jgi:hypothetical protein
MFEVSKVPRADAAVSGASGYISNNEQRDKNGKESANHYDENSYFAAM